MISLWIRLHDGIGRAKNLVKDSGISRSTSLTLVHNTTARLFALWDENSFRFAEKGTGPLSPSRARRHKVKPNVQHLQNVHIPTFALPPRPTSNRRGKHRDLSRGEKIITDADDNDALEDWNERASSLFEWIGMVNIGAQRYVSQ
jgi:hypothetical protein